MIEESLYIGERISCTYVISDWVGSRNGLNILQKRKTLTRVRNQIWFHSAILIKISVTRICHIKSSPPSNIIYIYIYIERERERERQTDIDRDRDRGGKTIEWGE
jgi:hypothetical protein